jgi:acyl-CoA reductase-like NAD-dependent aldehyde dehydrogenase
MSTDIIMVHKDITNEFLRTLKQTVTAMQASSKSLPVVVSSAAVSRIAALIEDATKKGGMFSTEAFLSLNKRPLR